MPPLVERLRELGLGDYEARLYAALVRRHPASGYELAREAGVPSSKVYEVLGRLQEKDLAFPADGGRGKRWVPADPEDVVARWGRRVHRALEGLREEIRALGTDEPVSYIWNVHGREALLERATHLLASAERTALVSGWDEELAVLADDVATAHRRGVRVAVVVYGALALDADAVYPHPIQDTIHAEKGGRGLTLCVDARVAVVGLVAGGGASGAWSSNGGFVTAVEDYLKHDIYVQKIVGRFEDLLVRTYGRDFARWRDPFSDRALPARARLRAPRRP